MLTTASPEELLQRGFVSAETLPPPAQAFWACEYERGDYNTFAALARRRAPVGILSEATRGRPQRSPRYREFLGPLGMPFEMRTAFVTRGRVWGCVVFHTLRRVSPRHRRKDTIAPPDMLAPEHPTTQAWPGSSELDEAGRVERLGHDARTVRPPHGRLGVGRRLRAGLEDEVEWRLGGTPYSGEAGSL